MSDLVTREAKRLVNAGHDIQVWLNSAQRLVTVYGIKEHNSTLIEIDVSGNGACWIVPVADIGAIYYDKSQAPEATTGTYGF